MEYNFKLTKVQKALLLEVAKATLENRRSTHIVETYKPGAALRDLGLIVATVRYPDKWKLTLDGREYLKSLGYTFPEPKKMLNIGLSANRFESNPEEKRFAEAWDAINQPIGTPGVEGPTLAHMMVAWDEYRNFAHLREPTREERIIAATVIQWLGSGVGQHFLHGLGYRYNERSKEEE